jgi:hypothetical protein
LIRDLQTESLSFFGNNELLKNLRLSIKIKMPDSFLQIKVKCFIDSDHHVLLSGYGNGQFDCINLVDLCVENFTVSCSKLFFDFATRDPPTQILLKQIDWQERLLKYHN